MAPTVPSRLISPVTATSLPPVRLPGDSSSIRVSVNASPADGPPMLPVSMSISKGSSTVAVSNGTNPMIARVGSSGEAISSTETVLRPSPGRSISSSTVSPALWSASSATRSSTVASGTPLAVSSVSPWSRNSSAGEYRAHPSGPSSKHTRSLTTTLPGRMRASS